MTGRGFLRIAIDVAIVVALVVVGLGVWAGQQRPPDPYLKAIMQRGTLKVGIDPTYPPFESLSGGQFVGYDPGLARAIGDNLGVGVEFVPIALDTMYDALAAGKVDMLISALPFVYERQSDVRYSTPYYQAGQVLVVRAGNDSIASVRDLAGKMVGVELGSNADTEARRLARTSVPGMQLQSVYHSPEDALDALARGDIDAIITENESAQSYLVSHPGTVSLLSPSITDEPYVIAMPVKATALSARVDETIQSLRASGRLAQMMGLAGQ